MFSFAEVSNQATKPRSLQYSSILAALFTSPSFGWSHWKMRVNAYFYSQQIKRKKLRSYWHADLTTTKCNKTEWKHNLFKNICFKADFVWFLISSWKYCYFYFSCTYKDFCTTWIEQSLNGCQQLANEVIFPSAEGINIWKWKEEWRKGRFTQNLTLRHYFIILLMTDFFFSNFSTTCI